MKIESGKFYKTRDGQKVQVEPWNKVFCSVNPINNYGRIFGVDGKHGYDLIDNIPELDLVAEWYGVGDTGTLEELGVNAGDVVECVKWDGFYWTNNREYKIQENNKIQNNTGSEYSISSVGRMGLWRIVSRATPQPTLWRDMTDAEKGALLLAKHEGKAIEILMTVGKYWREISSDEKTHFHSGSKYRVKPKPEVEVVTVMMHHGPNNIPHTAEHMSNPTHKLTFTTEDGEIDCASAVLVKL